MGEEYDDVDWTGINIVLPGTSALTGKILNLLRESGFVEYDYCSLYHWGEGAVADYFPCPQPRHDNSLKEYISYVESGRE